MNKCRSARYSSLVVSLLIFFFFTPLIHARQNSAKPKINLERVISQLEPEIQRTLIEGKIPSCSIALVAGDEIIWSNAYGYANLWARTPAVPNTVYLIGSTFKAMATVALLQQMEQGKFKLDDRVNDYLSEFKIEGEDAKNPITFRHLLTHVSGLPAAFGPVLVWGDGGVPSLEEYLRKDLKVARPPMEKEEYSNLAYTLIGYLVQKFSGVPFKKYMQDNIFAPLEMNNTAINLRPDMDERLAVPYVVDEKTGSQMPTERLKAMVWPAGIVYGTVLNQANWLIMNLNGGTFKDKRLLSEATHNQMLTRQHDKFKGKVEGLWGGDEAGFGLTWWVERRNGELYFAHSGSVPGYTAFLQGNRDKRLGFAILTNGNRAHPHLIKLADKALDLMKANMQ
ncbi:MAG: serine hydrolase domain-containing protein [Acidobacteriota bacterium]